MSNIKTTIGQRIRNQRIHKGYSQEQLAELANCHPTYIGQLERGEKNATLESVQKIANALKIPLSQLFEKIEDVNEEDNIPLKCYELFASKNRNDQQTLYQILLDIEKYKNKT